VTIVWLSRGGALGAALLAVLLFLLSSSAAPESADAAGQEEVRALWVDAFHDGIKSPAQVARLVSDARRANVNTLLVQVRKRGEVYYLGGTEPRAPDQPAGYDALRAILDAARNGSPRLEVHAWIPAYVIWSARDTPPLDPNHPFNRHGLSVSGEDNWLMLRDDGESWTGEGYWLDPGHPAVADYTVTLATDLVSRYDVDGLHLDRLRYHQGDGLGGGVWDRRWGYNPASVIRFDLDNGRVGQPDSNDPLWAQYRRDKVTDLLRRVRESSLAVRPGLKISAALIPWGAGPRTDAEWARSPAYAYVFQDWRSWLEQGLLDQGYVMNYNREAMPNQTAWLDQWLAWQRSHTYGRQLIAGLGIYLNTPADSVKQLRRALASGPNGARLAGVALYSYASPDLSRLNTDPADNTPDGFMWDLLTQPLPDNDHSPPFAEPAAVPPMPWRQ
jgi:uncharacterized lipoprotein YddW (UPF0748 family)